MEVTGKRKAEFNVQIMYFVGSFSSQSFVPLETLITCLCATGTDWCDSYWQEAPLAATNTTYLNLRPSV